MSPNERRYMSELLKQVLEALRNSYPMQTSTPREHQEAITAIKSALADLEGVDRV